MTMTWEHVGRHGAGQVPERSLCGYSAVVQTELNIGPELTIACAPGVGFADQDTRPTNCVTAATLLKTLALPQQLTLAVKLEESGERS